MGISERKEANCESDKETGRHCELAGALDAAYVNKSAHTMTM